MKEEKFALVTGGSRGIGLGITEKLLQNNYSVVINGVRSESEVDDQLGKLRRNGGKILYCQGDIGTTEGRNKIVSFIKELGAINVLVNNAGVASSRKDILEINEEDFDRVLGINLKGTFFLSQAIAKLMVKNKRENKNYEGCIVNVSSISSVVASVNRAEYCISKTGVSMLTKLLAIKMAEVDIPVYEIQPGVIETDMIERVKEKYEQLIEEGLTLQKRMGTPEDIGKIVVVLANGDLPYSTGQVLTPDGGLMVWRF